MKAGSGKPDEPAYRCSKCAVFAVPVPGSLETFMSPENAAHRESVTRAARALLGSLPAKFKEHSDEPPEDIDSFVTMEEADEAVARWHLRAELSRTRFVLLTQCGDVVQLRTNAPGLEDALAFMETRMADFDDGRRYQRSKMAVDPVQSREDPRQFLEVEPMNEYEWSAK